MLRSIVNKLCGFSFPETVEYGDIIQGLPVKRESCAGVYCSHVLEHLTLTDLRKALRNTHGYLAEGGIFRLVLPDLEDYIRRYLASSKPDAALEFMADTLLGVYERDRSPGSLLRTAYGASRHLWMWDYKSLEAELQAAGFRSIRRAQVGDSADPRFSEVEKPERWTDALGIECVR